MSDHGIRIKERMAGWIRLNELATSYPFEINICAFGNEIKYPIPFHFEGAAYLPGFPLPLNNTEKALRPFISGEMKISHNGVEYDFPIVLPGVGEVRIQGQKKYHYTLNWKIFRESLIKLPFNVYKNDQIIGNGVMFYLPPLYHFIFGVNFASSYTAFEPRRRFYESLMLLIPVISPVQAYKIDLAESFVLIRKQLHSMSTFLFFILYMNLFFLKLFSLMRFFKTIKNLNDKEHEAFAQLLSKNSYLHCFSLPLRTIVVTSVYATRSFLNITDQNQPTKLPIDEVEKWRELNITCICT